MPYDSPTEVAMTITSTAFQTNEYIPVEYTCDGDNVHPPLTFSEVPAEAESLVLIVDDPDAPHGLFTHWLLYDLSPGNLQILQNEVPEPGTQGTNDFMQVQYGGPCPPSGVHRYFFTLYALQSQPNIAPAANRATVNAAMRDQILATAQLVGLYEKQNLPSETLAFHNNEDVTDDRNTTDSQITTAKQISWRPRRSHI